MNVLVVTSEPVTAEQIKAALAWSSDDQDMQVMVVAPALQPAEVLAVRRRRRHRSR